jgi:hypothetical protein
MTVASSETLLAEVKLAGAQRTPDAGIVSGADVGCLAVFLNVVRDAIGHPDRPVIVTSRNSRGWRAELIEHDVVCQGHSLAALDRRVRELLGPQPLDYQFRTGDAELDRLVAAARAARWAARRFEDQARRLTERVLVLPIGASGRDLGVLLDLSHQRVQQLMRRVWRGGRPRPEPVSANEPEPLG